MSVHRIPITAEMAAEAAAMREQMDRALLHTLEPWRKADRNPMPTFDLFPTLTRWERRYRFLKSRLSDVWYAARYGIPEPEWDD